MLFIIINTNNFVILLCAFVIFDYNIYFSFIYLVLVLAQF